MRAPYFSAIQKELKHEQTGALSHPDDRDYRSGSGPSTNGWLRIFLGFSFTICFLF